MMQSGQPNSKAACDQTYHATVRPAAQWPRKIWFGIRFPIRVIHFHSAKHADNEMVRSLKLGKNCFFNQKYGAPTTIDPGRFMATVSYNK